MRALVLVALLLLAGCTGAPAVEPETSALRMLALDGRWPFEAARAEAMLARADAAAGVGAFVAGEARGARVLDFVGLDAVAATTLEAETPASGEAFAMRDSGLVVGEEVTLRSHVWPTPYVATYFEMERTPTCDSRPHDKLCFLPSEADQARLRIRVDPGGRDAGFLPDLVELGVGARPAYWNGTFEGPAGERIPFSAVAPVEGPLQVGQMDGPMSAGHWNITFRIEAGGKPASAGAAGIVRVREPGYLWFDDRLQEVTAPAAQSRAVIANATPTSVTVRIARVIDDAPLRADVLLALDDARALAGTSDVTGLLARLTPTQEQALASARGPEGLTLALRARALPGPASSGAAEEGALVFAAPFDVDLASLPRIEGALAPELALASRPPLGEPLRLDGAFLGDRVLLLAHAAGAPTWGLPDGGRWTRVEEALENLSRSRTLALGSPDLVQGGYATARIEVGTANATRTVVAIGGVTGGPSQTFWTSAALAAGIAQPVAPRVLVPLAPGADRDDVLAAARDAWGPFGLALDR